MSTSMPERRIWIARRSRQVRFPVPAHASTMDELYTFTLGFTALLNLWASLGGCVRGMASELADALTGLFPGVQGLRRFPRGGKDQGAVARHMGTTQAGRFRCWMQRRWTDGVRRTLNHAVRTRADSLSTLLLLSSILLIIRDSIGGPAWRARSLWFF
jgi:hypothetical protein